MNKENIKKIFNNINKDICKNAKEIHKYSFIVLAIILSIFLITLIISTVVGVQNKIKEGKYIGQEINVRNTITVSDTGVIYAKPDLAIINFSVKTESEIVMEAMNDNAKRMNEIISSMTEAEIRREDLQTTSVNIYPRYEYYKETEVPPYPSGERVLVGYEVTQGLQVKIRDIKKIGIVINRAIDSGANQVGNLQFTIDKQDEFKQRARRQAIEKAKTKAEELASQLDVNLVRITNFTESSFIPRFYGLEQATGIGGGETPQIEVGENKIEVTVFITYEIN